MTPVEEHVTRRFMKLFGAPETADPKGFVAEYERALHGTEPSLLRAAADDLIDNKHRYKGWPKIAECKEAINRAALQRANKQNWGNPERPEHRKTPTLEERARVAALVAETVGKLKGMEPAAPRNKFDFKTVDRAHWERRFGGKS